MHREGKPLVRIGNLEIDFGTRRAFVDSTMVDVTDREFMLLATLADRVGELVPKEALVTLPSTTGDGAGTSFNTIEVTLSRLRRKLRDARVDIRAARGVGYVLTPRDGA